MGKDEGKQGLSGPAISKQRIQNATVLSSRDDDIRYEVFSGLPMVNKGRWYRSFFMRGASTNCKKGFDATLGQTVPTPNSL